MTELSPLVELASSSILLLFMGLPVAWRGKGFKQALRDQVSVAPKAMAYAVLVITGVFIGIAAWMARYLTAWTHGLVELWSPRHARVLFDWNGRLFKYCMNRRFYQPQHAA